MDIYVLGSGATLDYIKPTFFENKHVIATNLVGERLGLYDIGCRRLFTHSHYHEDTFMLAEKYPHHFFWTPLGDQGHSAEPKRDDLPNVVFYPHEPTKYDFNVDDAWPRHESGLIVGSTSVHGSMHLACKLGASTVILVGVDCGLLDGRANQQGYESGNLVTSDTIGWLARWELHLREVKDRLRAVYQVDFHSLNPFINLNLEGHEWTNPLR